MFLKEFSDDVCNPDKLTPLTLSFVGDAVFDLIVRQRIASKYFLPIGELNKIKVKTVCCKSQCEIYKKLKDILSEEEVKVYKWGRNAHVNQIPKNATPSEYHSATGLEALFGYLYLRGNFKRLKELIDFGVEI